MSKTIYLSTPTNSGKGRFDFVYNPINYTITTINIFDYKSVLLDMDELGIQPKKLDINSLQIYIYEPAFKILDLLKRRQPISINITKDLHE